MEIKSDNPDHGFQFPGTFEITAMGAANVGLESEIPRLLTGAGLTVLEDVQLEAFRFLTLDFEQPADHLNPQGERDQERSQPGTYAAPARRQAWPNLLHPATLSKRGTSWEPLNGWISS